MNGSRVCQKRTRLCPVEDCLVRWLGIPSISMSTGLHCALCAKQCTLQECAIDECGRAVHYQCLAAKFLREENDMRLLKDCLFFNQLS
jgi:hypothetical protein